MLEMLTVKDITELGILSVIAYFYIKSNVKREERDEKVVEKVFNKLLSSETSEETKPDGSKVKTKVVTLDRVLIERLDKYEEKNIKEHNEIKSMLNNFESNFDELKKQVSEMFNAMKAEQNYIANHKNYEVVLREKISNALPYFSNENLRIYIVDQSVNYIKWVLKSSEFMFRSENDMNLCLAELQSSCFVSTNKCKELLPKETCERYAERRKQKIEKYIQEVKEIKDDRVNDRISRLVDLSKLFMQNNISIILNTWMEHFGTPEDMEGHEWKRESFDGAEELKRIEQINNTNEE